MILTQRSEAVTAIVTAMAIAVVSVKSPRVPKVNLLIKVKKASKAVPPHN